MCPVAQECLSTGVENHEWGMWGGVMLAGGMTPSRRPQKEAPERKPPAESLDEAVVVLAVEGRRPRALSRAEKYEVVSRLWAKGLNDQLIAPHIGLSPDSVRKIRERLDLPTLTNMRHTSTPEAREHVERLIGDGFRDMQVSRETGVSRKTVAGIRRRLNVVAKQRPKKTKGGVAA